MERRYQVFVSSTYQDLVEERSEIMQVLLELDCMPAGMELFPASNETQWNWIRKVIDESDYYIVIVGGRYGSVHPESGISYTEMEYRYAVDTGKPVMSFLHSDPEKFSAKHTETTASRRKKLDAFRELVKQRLCRFYDTPQDLGSKVSRSLTQMKKTHPAVGWVKADVLNTLATSDEVLRLTRENDELRSKLYYLNKETPMTASNLASGEELFDVRYAYQMEALNPQTGRYKKASSGHGVTPVSWKRLFRAMAPGLLQQRRYYYGDSVDINSVVLAEVEHQLEKKHPAERVSSVGITADCRQTINLQFRALGYIEIGENGSWELTDLGDSYMTELYAITTEATSQ